MPWKKRRAVNREGATGGRAAVVVLARALAAEMRTYGERDICEACERVGGREALHVPADRLEWLREWDAVLELAERGADAEGDRAKLRELRRALRELDAEGQTAPAKHRARYVDVSPSELDISELTGAERRVLALALTSGDPGPAYETIDGDRRVHSRFDRVDVGLGVWDDLGLRAQLDGLTAGG